VPTFKREGKGQTKRKEGEAMWGSLFSDRAPGSLKSMQDHSVNMLMSQNTTRFGHLAGKESAKGRRVKTPAAAALKRTSFKACGDFREESREPSSGWKNSQKEKSRSLIHSPENGRLGEERDGIRIKEQREETKSRPCSVAFKRLSSQRRNYERPARGKKRNKKGGGVKER